MAWLVDGGCWCRDYAQDAGHRRSAALGEHLYRCVPGVHCMVMANGRLWTLLTGLGPPQPLWHSMQHGPCCRLHAFNKAALYLQHVAVGSTAVGLLAVPHMHHMQVTC
jgi:hypothetical protein